MQYKIGDKVELTNGSIAEITSYANSMSGEEGYIVNNSILKRPNEIVKKVD